MAINHGTKRRSMEVAERTRRRLGKTTTLTPHRVDRWTDCGSCFLTPLRDAGRPSAHGVLDTAVTDSPRNLHPADPLGIPTASGSREG